LKVYSVSEITRHIRTLLEGQFSEIGLEGEISNFKAATSGHLYFSLKDANSQIRCVLFRGMAQKLRFKPEDGLSVLLFGRVTVYELRGEYQILVDHMEPQGIGALQLAFEQLKKKLEAEGLFDASRKKPLPFLPKKIGIVTSPTGAVIRDMIHVLTRRFPNIQILLNPVAVQGLQAGPEIASAIFEMSERDDLDVLIVGRGGGSIEDLWAFNEEVVARAIAHCRIPVVSAVGHETDFTIADFVADVRAPTPSAAAELVVPVKEDLLYDLGKQRHQLYQAITQKLEGLRLGLRQWEGYFKDPTRGISEKLLRLDHVRERMIRATTHQATLLESTMKNWVDRLRSLNPLAILDRGYAIATLQGGTTPLVEAGQVIPGDVVAVRLARGKFTSVVQKGY